MFDSQPLQFNDDSEQIVHTHVPLSANSWYRLKNNGNSDLMVHLPV